MKYKNLECFKSYNCLTFFEPCILTLPSAFFLFKNHFQKLIFSEYKLQYKIQFLRNPQFKITLENSRIDFFDAQNHHFVGALARARS